MTNPPSDGQNAPLWTVGVPQQTSVPDAAKGYVPGWSIPVIMFDKSSFSVTVSADQFTPEAVMAAIEDHVNRLIAIRSLKGVSY